MTDMIGRAGLKVATPLVEFVEELVLPALGIEPDGWWKGVANIFERFGPENAQLLHRRDDIQSRIDAWHIAHRDLPFDTAEYRAFLVELGYLVPEPMPFVIGTTNVDAEIATMAGPQLVVPVLNARFVLNAANARWGSLYDALYGTDALPGVPAGSGYDAVRGGAVIDRAKVFLDEVVPLAAGSWKDFAGGELVLADASQLVGRSGESWLFRHNGLHIEVVVEREHRIGRADPAGIADVLLEAALSTIVDLEDSVAVVDAEDKVAAYANWLGLMPGDLEETFDKGGVAITRRLNPDRVYEAANGGALIIPGRSILFVRNVGHMMTTPAVLLQGEEAPEGILDAILTSTIALYDLKGVGLLRNSRTGSVYIVKPKMHGPAEAGFTDRLFDAVEDLLGLARHTIKVGVMDEERRTSANLAATIEAVRDRVAFINTGFLDRTGDELHTSMQAGAMIPKAEMKGSVWIKAYEDRNVRIGLACGLSGKAQIGKGMWAAPDRMADMLAQKIGHPLSGANTAWVPSPTAATLHALHYHQVDVFDRQRAITSEAIPELDALLTIPLASGKNWTRDEITRELDNNAQGILGYVVRWIDQGIGCSKVPDIDDIGLMEDRATLRISSQHVANWLLHGVATAADVDAAFDRMARKVDAQNVGDPVYRPLCGESIALKAARALVLQGVSQPNGYTEPLLHRFRAEVKEAALRKRG